MSPLQCLTISIAAQRLALQVLILLKHCTSEGYTLSS